MTTTVTVTTHDRPAEVRSYPLDSGAPHEDGSWSEAERIEPNSTRQFYVHSSQDLMVHELPHSQAD